MDDLKAQLQEKDNLIDSLNKKLTDRKIELQEAGTIAEASFKMNGVLESAEKAAQQYLENIQELHDKEKALYTEKEEAFEKAIAYLLKKKWVTAQRNFSRKTSDKTERIAVLAVSAEEALEEKSYSW